MAANRFTALDSWRGIAACMVALFHIRAYSHVEELALVRNAYLFVDFFFVLSGFVIAATYQERLAGGFSVWRFMLLRFGRVYPLHAAVLLAFWLHEAPSPDRLDAALAHLLLVNGLSEGENTLWNAPSWTISTEFFTYLAFALAVAALRGRIGLILLAVLLAFPVVIYVLKGDMNATHGIGMVRCLYGFAAGVTAWHVFRRFEGRIPGGSLAEAACVGAVLLFIIALGKGASSIAAPIVFAATVLVFARQSGAASRLLAWRPFLFLGTVSYSIYMVHYFIVRRMVDAVMFGKAHHIRALDYLGTERWAGDVALALYLAIVVGVSAASYRLVEAPSREWFRRIARRGQPARAAT